MGGGLNISEKGGMLDAHVDGNYNSQTGLNRRLSCIIYLTKNWKKKYGGQLGLYNEKGSKLIKLIEPKFNRLLVFNTNDYRTMESQTQLIFQKIIHVSQLFYTIIRRTREKIQKQILKNPTVLFGLKKITKIIKIKLIESFISQLFFLNN